MIILVLLEGHYVNISFQAKKKKQAKNRIRLRCAARGVLCGFMRPAEFYAGCGVQSVGWAAISFFPFQLSFSIGCLEGFGRRLAKRNDEQIQWQEASSNLYK